MCTKARLESVETISYDKIKLSSRDQSRILDIYIYSWTSVIRPPVIWISILSSCDLTVVKIQFYLILYQFYINDEFVTNIVAMSKYVIMCITLLNLLCLSITPISGQIAYPERCRFYRGRITELGLYMNVYFYINIAAVSLSVVRKSNIFGKRYV